MIALKQNELKRIEQQLQNAKVQSSTSSSTSLSTKLPERARPEKFPSPTEAGLTVDGASALLFGTTQKKASVLSTILGVHTNNDNPEVVRAQLEASKALNITDGEFEDFYRAIRGVLSIRDAFKNKAQALSSIAKAIAGKLE